MILVTHYASGDVSRLLGVERGQKRLIEIRHLHVPCFRKSPCVRRCYLSVHGSVLFLHYQPRLFPFRCLKAVKLVAAVDLLVTYPRELRKP